MLKTKKKAKPTGPVWEVPFFNNRTNYLSTITLNPWIPHEPSPRQKEFILLPQLEALYGGAARGGKSDALLMCAAQFIDIPNYSAIIFRRTLPELQMPDGLIPRSQDWWGSSDAHWDGNLHEWTFPKGSIIKFGYIGSDVLTGRTKYRYQGARLQFVGWDELTSQYPEDYFYLFSRLDRPNCEKHRPGGYGDFFPNCELCQAAKHLNRVPFRVRSATNPGGAGAGWVKEHFQIERDDATGLWIGRNPDAPFIPAFARDNPAVDVAGYVSNLERMKDHVTRKQLLEGDWGISEEGRFKAEWLRHYEVKRLKNAAWIDAGPELWRSHDDQSILTRLSELTFYVGERRWPLCQLNIFATVDPATSEREGPGDTQRYRKEPSNTVISTWALTPQADLLWLDCWAFQKEIPEVVQGIQRAYHKWKPSYVAIENNGSNIGVYQLAIRVGLPVRPLEPGSNDKLVRSTDAQVRMEQGKIFAPRYAPWCKDTFTELFDWTGHKHQAADRVDTLSYAAMLVSEDSITRPVIPLSIYDMPMVMR